MFEAFGAAKGILKRRQVNIDNHVFWLHSKASFGVLFVCSVLVTSSQYFGSPIECIVDEIPTAVMDAYCWIYSTFTVTHGLKDRVGLDVIQTGVKNFVPGEDGVKYHRYYQWVFFALFFQAILFYLPHYLWKTWEKNRLSILVSDLRKPLLPKNEVEEQIQVIVDYFEGNWHANNVYSYEFFFCEFLNFVNVVGQIFFLDFFLDGEFSAYGLKVFEMTEEVSPLARTDAMAQVFPKVTKCTFQKYGPSGTVQKFDGLCILSLNIVNEKIYVFLWFWFVALATVTGLYLVYRILSIVSKSLRVWAMLRITNLADSAKIRDIAKMCYVGDWFLLCQIGQNIDPHAYKILIEKLHESPKVKRA